MSKLSSAACGAEGSSADKHARGEVFAGTDRVVAGCHEGLSAVEVGWLGKVGQRALSEVTGLAFQRPFLRECGDVFCLPTWSVQGRDDRSSE